MTGSETFNLLTTTQSENVTSLLLGRGRNTGTTGRGRTVSCPSLITKQLTHLLIASKNYGQT